MRTTTIATNNEKNMIGYDKTHAFFFLDKKIMLVSFLGFSAPIGTHVQTLFCLF